jgi:hypothetical protein
LVEQIKPKKEEKKWRRKLNSVMNDQENAAVLCSYSSKMLNVLQEHISQFVATRATSSVNQNCYPHWLCVITR